MPPQLKITNVEKTKNNLTAITSKNHQVAEEEEEEDEEDYCSSSEEESTDDEDDNTSNDNNNNELNCRYKQPSATTSVRLRKITTTLRDDNFLRGSFSCGEALSSTPHPGLRISSFGSRRKFISLPLSK